MTTPSSHDHLLAKLDETMADAARFFMLSDEHLSDGYQTARECLAHLLFWLLEFTHIVEAHLANTPYALRAGTFAELNTRATRQVPDEPMHILAKRLLYRQKHLAKVLCQLPNWHVTFALKANVHPVTVAEHVRQIESHIRNHVARLQSAAREAALYDRHSPYGLKVSDLMDLRRVGGDHV